MKARNFLMLLLLLATCFVGSSVLCSCSKDDVEDTPPATVTPPGDNVTEEKDTHEYVDLGLPSGTLWATCNVGASKPEEYGDYYAWGETEPKNEHSWVSYKYCKGSKSTMTKYCTRSSDGAVDNKTELEPSDDAATVNWGSGWQMPSDEQLAELINSNYTTTTWTTLNGVRGRKITSKSNGNSIFLPAAGWRDGTSLDDAGSDGYYWSRSLSTAPYSYNAYYLNFHPNKIYTSGYSHRYDGLSVRPVRVERNIISVANIRLNKTELFLVPKAFARLTATALPWYATNRNVKWESSNKGIASVDETGKVTALAVGSCTITCSAADGSGVKAECKVTIMNDDSGSADINEYVDLGLPSGTLWATCNVGANSPEEYGDYFAWGETQPKDVYSSSTYKYYKGSSSTLTKYCTDNYYGTVDNKTELEAKDDATTVNWGSDWQMPSEEQFDELINSRYTTTTWTTLNGVSGRMIVSKSNGNSIFLPAAGYRSDTGLLNAGSCGYYWSRSLCASCDLAYSLYFNSSDIYEYGDDRYVGRSVRPVRVH